MIFLKDFNKPEIIVNLEKCTRYRAVHSLGEGAFGYCYILKDDAGRTYAGKFLEEGADSQVEIKLHASLSHTNVVRLVDSFQLKDCQRTVCLMEYCPFGTLMDVMMRRGRLTPVEARYYIHQVVCGAKYLHSENIVHGDLKPANLFLSDWGRLKIGDFGLSARVDAPDWRVEKARVVGTPNYMPPETFLGLGRGPPGDLWALGCILYFLLVGRPPFQRDTLLETVRCIVEVQYARHEAGVSRTCAAFIGRLLDKLPHARPSAEALLNDPYFTKYFVPSKLPLTALYYPPDMKLLVKKYSAPKKNKRSGKKVKKKFKKF